MISIKYIVFFLRFIGYKSKTDVNIQDASLNREYKDRIRFRKNQYCDFKIVQNIYTRHKIV